MLSGETGSNARAVSGDGKVVVGGSGLLGFRWTETGGMQALGFLPGGSYNGVFGVSGDGKVVIGEGSSDRADYEAYRWTAETGIVGLGDLPGGDLRSRALGASYDGSLVVGFGTTEVGADAFLWDEEHGVRELRAVLISLGVDMTGWELDSAEAISDDGIWIAGRGSYQGQAAGFLARLPEPGSGVLAALGLCGLAARRRGLRAA